MYFKIKLFFRQQPKANFYFSQPYFESYDGVLTIDAQFMCSMISLIYLSIKFVNQLVPKYINKGNGSRIKRHILLQGLGNESRHVSAHEDWREKVVRDW